MAFLGGLFRPAPQLDEIQDHEVVAAKYSYWRIRVFYSMFLGYVFYYLTRKSFTFAMPAMIHDLGLTKEQLGLIASIWSVTYGISKFASGVIGDRSNAKYFMAAGLMITGICNILFGCSSSFGMFAFFWGMNGWFQGFGWPSCARLLTHWYSQSERGRWWSFWNISHNIGGAVVPIITALFAQYFGWRYAMIIPGSVCITMSFILMNRLTDTPQGLGLPPIEKYRNDYPSKKAHKDPERELTVKEILFEYVFTNRFIWILAFGYYFVYMIRTAINDWTVLYLVESKGYTPLGASAIIIWFEVGGIFGSLVAGWASDKLFRARRGPVLSLFCLGVSLSTLFFLLAPQFALFAPLAALPITDCVMLFTFGFFTFGPQMMIGMAAAELSHKKAAATASGFTGLLAYLGAATAGYPLGALVQMFGWNAFFIVLIVCGLISMSLLLPLWSVKSRDDAATC